MNRISKVLLNLIITIITGLLLFQHYSLLSYNQTIISNRDYIKNTITINRNSYAIPTVISETLEEAIYGLGYAVGQDRLWQLTFRKFLSNGRLSELIGEKTLPMDKFIRNYQIPSLGISLFSSLDQKTKQLFQYYVDGINDARSSFTILPSEFWILNAKYENFTVEDICSIARLQQLVTSYDYNYELVRSKIEQLYGTEDAFVLGTIGENNQFQSQYTTVTKEDLISLGLYSPLDMTKIENKQPIDLQALKNFNSIADYLDQFSISTAGSNSWAVSGKHTKNGQPILSNDPHLDNNIPTQWYQIQLIYKIDGKERFIAGAQPPGIPSFMTGRNNELAWGVTILYNDNTDLFYEEIAYLDEQTELIQGERNSEMDLRNLEKQLFYKHNGQFMKATKIVEFINIKGNEKPIEFIVHKTHRGPIITESYSKFEKDKASSLQTDLSVSLVAAFQVSNDPTPAVALNYYYPSDFHGQIEALRKMVSPGLGIIIADGQGNIGYIAAGRNPIRNGDPLRAGFVKDSQNEWSGFVDPKDNIVIINPKSGFLATANNKYAPDSYKGKSTINSNPTARFQRIHQQLTKLISSGQKIDVNDMQQLQKDIVDPYAQIIVPDLLNILEKINTNPLFEELKDLKLVEQIKQIYKDWNYEMRKNSSAASLQMVFEHFYMFTFMDKLQKEGSILHKQWAAYYGFESFAFKHIQDINIQINKEEFKNLHKDYCLEGKTHFNCIEGIIQSYRKAINFLENKFGKNTLNWEWSKLHSYEEKHQPFANSGLKYLFNRKFPHEGNKRTISVSIPRLTDQTFNGFQGPNLRQVIDLSESHIYTVCDAGVNGNFLSPHYDDQLNLFRKGQYITIPLNDKSNQKYQTLIHPKQNSKLDL